ncbi:hypothetical protein ACQP1U_11720 [Actinomycetota bacterium]
MSIKRNVAVGAAVVALTATGGSAAQASSNTSSGRDGARSADGRTAATDFSSCNVHMESFTTSVHLMQDVAGKGMISAYSRPGWGLGVRSLAYYKRAKSGTKTTDYYYAISTGGYLYRVGETYDSATGRWSLAKVNAGGGSYWKSVKDINVSRTALYYITSTGELRRRAIIVGGQVTSAGTLIRSGLGITQLSNAGTSWESRNGVINVRYDQMLGITRGGALQQVAARYAGSAGYSSRLHTLKSSGWERFNSIDVGGCSGNAIGIVGRDWATKTAYAYYDANILNYSGSDLNFSHKPSGRLNSVTYGSGS